MMFACPEVVVEVRGRVGCLTLNRPKSINALSLPMIRAITAALLAWQQDPDVAAVAIRGTGKEGPFGHFCAGGDIRFFHKAALEGLVELEDFFTEEYALNHLIHRFGKPVLALMEGIVMGGGMGLAQGASHRVVTENSKLAMPETLIGLFPDVGGGYFLSRLAGRLGEWLALTGAVISGPTAVEIGWADRYMSSARLPELWDALAQMQAPRSEALQDLLASLGETSIVPEPLPRPQIDRYFAQASVSEIVASLAGEAHPWAQTALEALGKRSPLMLQVTLEQVRRARTMSLADELRMERDLVRHCFHPHHLHRRGGQTETAEGIRALAIDKDHHPRWLPAELDQVTTDMVAPFFVSPWPRWAHPLRALSD